MYSYREIALLPHVEQHHGNETERENGSHARNDNNRAEHTEKGH